MSQLFDSLRRDRDAAQPRVQAPRPAHGDAVLATLGYARVERRPAAAAVIAAALLFGIGMVLWSLWTFYGRSERSNPIPRPEAPRSSPRQTPAEQAPALSSTRSPRPGTRRCQSARSLAHRGTPLDAFAPDARATSRLAIAERAADSPDCRGDATTPSRTTIGNSCTMRSTNRRAPSSTTVGFSTLQGRTTPPAPPPSEPG